MSTPFDQFIPAPLGGHFAQGMDSARGIQSESLTAQSDKWNEAAQAAGRTPHSVLQQLSPSPVVSNLSAPSQRDRLLPSGFILPNLGNSASSGTADNEQQLRMAGGN